MHPAGLCGFLPVFSPYSSFRIHHSSFQFSPRSQAPPGNAYLKALPFFRMHPAGLQDEYRMSNKEYRMMRYHTSKFCGSLFDIRHFSIKSMVQGMHPAGLPGYGLLHVFFHIHHSSSFISQVGKEDDVSDRRGIGQKHNKPVNADPFTCGRRHSVFKRPDKILVQH